MTKRRGNVVVNYRRLSRLVGVNEAIAKRSCYRDSFKDILAPCDVLVRVIDAGLEVPSVCNIQTTPFATIDDPVVLNEFAEMLSTSARKTSKAVVVCVSDDCLASFMKKGCTTLVGYVFSALNALGCSYVRIDGALRFDQKS